MKYQRSNLFILAGLLSVGGLPDLGHLDFLQAPNAYASHKGAFDADDVAGMGTSISRDRKKKGPGLLGRLKNALQGPEDPATWYAPPQKTPAAQRKESRPAKKEEPRDSKPPKQEARSYDQDRQEERSARTRKEKVQEPALTFTVPIRQPEFAMAQGFQSDYALHRAKGEATQAIDRNNQAVQAMSAELVSLQHQTMQAEIEMERCRKNVEMCRTAERSKQSQITATQASNAKPEAKLRLLEGTELSYSILDNLNETRVRQYLAEGSWVALALGNHLNLEADSVSEVQALIQKLYNKGYKVVYDADSLMGQEIGRFLGEHGMGISGNPAVRSWDKSPIYVINNPYIRLELFGRADKIVVSPGSTVGMGLILEHYKKDVLVFDPKGVWKKGLSDWPKKLTYENRSNVDSVGNVYRPTGSVMSHSTWDEPRAENRPKNLGISYPQFNEPKAYRSSDALLAALAGIKVIPHSVSTFSLSPMEIFDRTSEDRFQDILSRSKSYVEHAQTIRSHAARYRFGNNGAAFFGSKQKNTEYDDRVKEVVEAAVRMGFSISSGGSGGLMDAANSVAKIRPGFSIGITYSEIGEKAANSLHDLSIATKGYHERIPLILQDKDIVLVAPGGEGTMKEVATLLVAMGWGQLESKPWIFLICEDYYKRLASFLENLDPLVYQKIGRAESAKQFQDSFRSPQAENGATQVGDVTYPFSDQFEAQSSL